jgi:hypothetical protein
MLDRTIPSDLRLSLYLSTRLLQELSVALQLMGVPSVHIRAGIGGVAFPRLYVGCTDDDLQGRDERAELDDFVCSVPFASCPRPPSSPPSDPEWWFVWWGDQVRHEAPGVRVEVKDLTAGSSQRPG